MTANCKHNHECSQCIKVEIQNLQKKIDALRARLPDVTTIIDRQYIPYPQYIRAVPMPFGNGQFLQSNLANSNQLLCGSTAGASAANI